MPPIGFWGYSSKNLNPFLAHCGGQSMLIPDPSVIWGTRVDISIVERIKNFDMALRAQFKEKFDSEIFMYIHMY